MDGMSSTMSMVNSTMDHSHHHDMNSTMDMDQHHDHDGMHSMMPMYFYFGATNVTILFQSWIVNSPGAMAGACVGVFILAALYEGLKVLREMLLQKTSLKLRSKATSNGVEYSNGQLVDSGSTAMKYGSTIWSWWHLLQTLLHLVQVTISYALMLIIMTYNWYLTISILVGAGVGYFAFGWKKAVIIDVNEHCH